MPQQSDDLQIKWQKCLHETFFACDVVYRYAPHVLDKIEEGGQSDYYLCKTVV